VLRTRVNHQIKAPTVRVISEEGKQIGVMKLSEALTLANEHGLDLVEVSPLANPPVCKLIDIAKFRYQQKKMEQQQKKNAKKVELKTIWISMRISEHDMQIKAKKVSEFLTEGNVVKVELRMRGREQAFGDLGRQNLLKFTALVLAPHRIEVPIKRMGGTWSLTVAPTKETANPKLQAVKQ
jgi:translation initiation factor IF-3